MDIGTAKPSPEERARLPHHLIDIRDPDEQFNAGEFVRLAGAACADIARRGALPVVSGGTGFYLRNFILGLPEAPPGDPEIRFRLKEELRRRGAGALAEELAAHDPVSAERIHVHDEYRLLRALEVFRMTGRPLSSYRQSGGAENACSGGSSRRYRFLIISLERPREELYRRINGRCAAMFRGGLPEEVEGLWKKGYTPLDPGLRAIGYREFFIEDPPGTFRLSADFASVEALAAQNSRRYAKRQICYFAPVPGVKRVAAGADSVSRIRKELEFFFESRI
jgi:tRNA dimethylallyltransferase